MNDITPGLFIPGDSVLHRRDARIKLCGLLWLIAAVISASESWDYVFLFCVIITIALGLARLPLPVALNAVWRLRLFFVVIFLMNTFFYDGGTPLWSWYFVQLSAEGARQGARVVLNVILIMLAANTLTCTTPPMQITAALVYLLTPLKVFRIPIGDAALILGAAFQFVPTLTADADKIKKAQIARGARFESKKLTEKAASYLPLLTPVFIAAFRRADELSVAMEARGYRGTTRHATHTGVANMQAAAQTLPPNDTPQEKIRHVAGPPRLADASALALCVVVFLLVRYVHLW